MSVMDRLFGGYWRPEPRHEHQWETIKEIEVQRHAFGALCSTDYVYHLRCKTCGEIGQSETAEVARRMRAVIARAEGG